MKTGDLNANEILAWMRRSFSIDAKHGYLIWTNPPKNHPRLIGCPAGTNRKNHNGKIYVHIKYNGLAIKRGWLIFLWRHKRWPVNCIDHIDGNSTNDRIINLRDATITQNSWNRKTVARRIKLPMGVRELASGRFQARLEVNKKMHHLGAFDNPEDAQKVYLAKRKEMYGEYA